jgi:ribosomal protein S18 acetylase RimI-like enzyme
MTKLGVRLATFGDEKAVKQILDSAAAIPASKGIEQWQDPFEMQSVERNIKKGGVYLFYDGKDNAIGTVDCRYEDRTVWGDDSSSALYIHRLAINPVYSGNRLGEQILDWVVSKARGENMEFVRLDCVAHNKKLCRYYEAYGFNYVRNANQFDLPSALYEFVLK